MESALSRGSVSGLHAFCGVAIQLALPSEYAATLPKGRRVILAELIGRDPVLPIRVAFETLRRRHVDLDGGDLGHFSLMDAMFEAPPIAGRALASMALPGRGGGVGSWRRSSFRLGNGVRSISVTEPAEGARAACRKSFGFPVATMTNFSRDRDTVPATSARTSARVTAVTAFWYWKMKSSG